MDADKQEAQNERTPPFERFKTLAERIVNVPREEIEQEQKIYEATKDKRTRRGKVKAFGPRLQMVHRQQDSTEWIPPVAWRSRERRHGLNPGASPPEAYHIFL